MSENSKAVTEMSESLNTHEPTPQPSDHPAAWDLVLADIRERDAMGKANYGVRLTPFNGRNFIKDAYQEALDKIVYLRGAVYEIEELQTKIVELESQLAASKANAEAWEATAKLSSTAKLSCGHPSACAVIIEGGKTGFCQWCRQLAAAKEDTERLDTVLGLGNYQFCVIDGGKYELWVMQNPPSADSDCFVGSTKREAIDAARKKEK